MTGDQYVNLVLKRLLGAISFREQLLEYLKEQYNDFVAKVYNKNGTYGTTAVAFGIASADEFDLTVDAEGTDGIGHLLKIGSTYEQDVKFENANTIPYHVGLHYTERPSGVQINPRTAYPEYESWKEAIGERGDPDTVADQTGFLRFEINSLVGGVNESPAGNKALVWKKVPAAGATSEAIAIEECTISEYGGVPTGTAYIDTAGYLGQDSPSLTASDYEVLVLGPTVRRYTDLSVASGYWYIGTVTGGGSGNPPSGSDTSGQRLIQKSLSDWLDYLVYSNVINTFTRKQIFAPTTAEEAINATGNGANPGVKATGGATNADGVQGYGGGTTGRGGYFQGGSSGGRGVHGLGTGSAEGVYGKGGDSSGAGVVGEGGAGPGTGVLGKPGTANGTSGVAVHGDGSANGGGYGGYFQGKTSTPVKAAACIAPQGADPSDLANGDHWQNSASWQAKVRVNGQNRVYAEPAKSRIFLYPVSSARPHYQSTMADPHWFYHAIGHYWNSDNTVSREQLNADLNRFLPQDVTITQMRAYLNPGTSGQALLNRERVSLYSWANDGSSSQLEARGYANDVTTGHWVTVKWAGTHTGADDQGTLTDSTKNWVVNSLVGRTIYNLTDGSSGTITANTANTVSATLSGGGNDWDNGDEYYISGSFTFLPANNRVYVAVIHSGDYAAIDIFRSLELTYQEGDYLRAP